jgi:hypothetical protein
MSDKRYALLGPDNKALNFILWDGETEFDHGQAQGNSLVLIEGIEDYGFGWEWDGTKFLSPSPASPPVPESISRRQCALELNAQGYITAQEALDMVKTAAVPAAIVSIFDAQVANGAWTAEQRLLAEIDFAAIGYYRSNSLLGLMGFTPEQLDAFFISASQR